METAGMGGAIPAQGMGGAIQPQHFQYVTHNNLKVKFLQFFFSKHKVLQFIYDCHLDHIKTILIILYRVVPYFSLFRLYIASVKG